jgi:transcriptional regulator with XRE-family HTH domain
MSAPPKTPPRLPGNPLSVRAFGRDILNLRQEDLAERFGVSTGTVLNMEKAGASRLARLALGLGNFGDAAAADYPAGSPCPAAEHPEFRKVREALVRHLRRLGFDGAFRIAVFRDPVGPRGFGTCVRLVRAEGCWNDDLRSRWSILAPADELDDLLCRFRGTSLPYLIQVLTRRFEGERGILSSALALHLICERLPRR